jgi:Tol biopolymer transport system component
VTHGRRILLGAIALSGCGRISFDSRDELRGDARGDGAADAVSCTWGPFGVPVQATALNTFSNDYGTAISADNLRIIFDSNFNSSGYKVYEATRTNTQSMFSGVTALTAINSTVDAGNPTMTPDATALYFSSARSGQDRIYRSERTTLAQPFSAPQLLPGMLATLAPISGPSISADELTLYFNRDANDGNGDDIYVATRGAITDGWDTIAPVTAVNTSMAEGVPSISSDGLELYFSRLTNGVGTDRIFVSRRASIATPFPAATQLVEIDMSSPESDPTISDDGTTLWFALYGTDADIYSAQRTCM